MIKKIYKIICINLPVNKNKIFISNTIKRVFTKANAIKLIVIFVAGFISRVSIGYIYSVNHLYANVNIFSIACLFSLFICLVPEFMHYFLCEIHNIIMNVFGFIIRIIISMNKRIFLCKLEDLKLHSIIKGVKSFSNRPTMGMYTSDSSSERTNTKLLNKENSYVLEKNDRDKPNEKPKTGLGYETRRETAARIRREETDRVRQLARIRREEEARIKEQQREDEWESLMEESKKDTRVYNYARYPRHINLPSINNPSLYANASNFLIDNKPINLPSISNDPVTHSNDTLPIMEPKAKANNSPKSSLPTSKDILAKGSQPYK